MINVVLRTSGVNPFDALITRTGATEIPSKNLPHWERPGGMETALQDFASLPGKSKTISAINPTILMKDMPNNAGRVVVRSVSNEGSPTLELQEPGGSSKIKAIRYRD